MNHVLLWKEYRQQRAIWLAIAFLAIFLVVVLALTMGHGGGPQAFRDDTIRTTLMMTVLALGVAYGIVCGSLLLAGEKEDRTLDFLDGLSGQREPVWRKKAAAGLLFTLAQGLVLVLLILVLGIGSWRTGPLLLYWCLDGLAWGLLGGALCHRVLTAVLAGIVCMAASWSLALLVDTSTALYLGKVLLAGAGVLYSRQIFCRDDRSRQTTPPRSRFTRFIPASWRVLLWLSYRQGRCVLAGGLAFAVALGLTVNLMPLILWPIGTLLLGLACGLACFCLDQGDGSRFLGAQRFSPGRIWTIKVLFWGICAVVLTALSWQLAWIYVFQTDPNASSLNRDFLHQLIFSSFFTEEIRAHPPWSLVLFLWPLYGFCFGQFFGQAATRPIIGAILATAAAPMFLGLWVPSLLIGGVRLWQFLAIPLILLLSTRLEIWPWVSGRLGTAKPLLGMGATVAVVVLSMAGFLWYRAVQVPDVGEPFDVKAFIAGLPTPEQNEAGRLIRRAGAAMREHKKKVEERIDPPTGPIFPKENGPGNAKLSVRAYDNFSWDIPYQGWPKKDKEIGRWLDLIFQGKWVQQANKAARLPLGLVQDPRLTSVFTNGACDDMQGNRI
jgi:hypothetical protein